MELLRIITNYLKEAILAELALQGRTITDSLRQSVATVVGNAGNDLIVIGDRLFYGKFVREGRQAGMNGSSLPGLISLISRMPYPGMESKVEVYPQLLSLKTRGAQSPYLSDTGADPVELARKLCDSYMEKLFNELKNQQ